VGQPGPPKKDEQQVIEVQEQLMETYQEQSTKNVHFPSQYCMLNLKGPKLEIFGSRVFPQIRPVWVGDLGIRQKNLTFYGLSLKIVVLYCLALSPTSLKLLSQTAPKIFYRHHRQRLKFLPPS
jgi:hypothetical protein